MLKEKKWLAMLLAVAMVFTIIPTTVFAVGTDEYFNVDGIYYQIVDENAKTVEVVHPKKSTGLTGAGASTYSGDFVVPATVENEEVVYNVVGIDTDAFYHADITSITLPEGLKYIDGGSFSQSNLTSIHIPATVERIGVVNNPEHMAINVSPVFNEANDPIRLESITFAQGSQLKAIGAGVFQYTDIKTIDLPDTLQTIDPYAFSACTELEEIVLPESVTDIYFKAFSGCSSLKELYIPADVDIHTEQGSNGSKFFGALSGLLDNGFGTVTFEEGSRYAVEDNLFYDGKDLLGPTDKNIESAIIREGTEMVAPYAFDYCGSLSYVDIPDSLTTVGQNSFSHCVSLENIDLNNITVFDRWAFRYSGLRSVTIPEGTTIIPIAIFANNDNLCYIRIPSTVESIEAGAFMKTDLDAELAVTIVMDGATPPTINSNSFRNIATETTTFIVPAGSEEAYAANEQFRPFVTNADGSIKDGISVGVEFPEDTQFCPGETFEIKYIMPEGASEGIRFDSTPGMKFEYNWDEETTSYVVTLLSGEGTIKVTPEINTIEAGNIFKQSKEFTVGHSYGEWKQTKAPDCTNAGTEERVCTDCQNKEMREIPALGHGETELKDAKEATCTAEGYTGDKVCKVCGEVVEQGKAIPKLAHSYKDGKCTVCGATDPNYKPTEPENPDKGDSNVPETGDNGNMMLWIALLFVSGAGLFGATAFSRKKKYSK